MFIPLSIWVFIIDCYSTFLSLFGFKDIKKDYEMIPDKTRFLILVAAHNEEAVLKASYENWQKIDYDPDFFDIVIVNDNSTDNTKKYSRS